MTILNTGFDEAYLVYRTLDPKLTGSPVRQREQQTEDERSCTNSVGICKNIGKYILQVTGN